MESIANEPRPGRPKGLIHHEFATENHTAKVHLCVSVLKTLMRTIRVVLDLNTLLQRAGSFYMKMHHLNGKYFAKIQVCVFYHPIFSPGMSPRLYLLFLKLKFILKGRLSEIV
ncbi:hypothetical protein NPIL_318631 [Nephila pilipes]|uniref:Uncharacterized protein n=1 Tax=Nephila pilipes TaxID=299642 RepID=A0A8X6TZ91_NEPPI|nr:hypothetical protein NPIL_318631 [Nephila pilipes]